MSNQITNPDTARAILSTAKEHSVWEAAIPTDEKKLLADANIVYEHAEIAWNNKNRGKAVSAVKFAAEVDGAHTGKNIDPLGATSEEKEESELEGILMQTIPQVKKEIDGYVNNPEFLGKLIDAEKKWKARRGVLSYVEQMLEDAYKEPDENGELESGNRGEAQGSGSVSPWESSPYAHPAIPDEPPGGFAISKFDEKFEAEEFARAQAKKMNLPVPGRVDDIPTPTLDRDVANLTISELGEKLNDASLCLAAATWQTALAEIDVEHTKRVGNHYFNKEFPRKQENAKNKDAAIALVEEVEKVAEWRQKQFEAESRHTTYRALKEIYSGTHNTISRIFAMKQEERERG